MKRCFELEKCGKKITVYGSRADIDKTTSLIENLDITGNEMKDRLLIQELIDNNKLKSRISYNSNTVYSFKKIIKAYRKLQKDDSLYGMTEELYHFFMYACGDIAHYNISGYIDNYGNSIRKLENTFLKDCTFAPRYTDVDRIFRELKIGKYYNEREAINLNNLPLKKLKNIITDCGWNVLEKNESLWELKINLNDNNVYCFDVEIGDSDVSTIIYSMIRYGINYNPDNYAEKIIKSRSKDDNSSARSIINYADMVKRKLMTLSSDILYKSRYEIETSKNTKIYDLELEK